MLREDHCSDSAVIRLVSCDSQSFDGGDRIQDYACCVATLLDLRTASHDELSNEHCEHLYSGSLDSTCVVRDTLCG